MGEAHNFAVLLCSGAVPAGSVSGRPIGRPEAAAPTEVISRPRCGFVMRYGAECSAHRRMHCP